MHQAAGIPSIADVERLLDSERYREHTTYSEQFLERHAGAMAAYGRHWGLDPFKLWSRRWEYPFVAERLEAFCRERLSAPVAVGAGATDTGDSADEPAPGVRVLDAGSGVTYFPYFIAERHPGARFVCCDYDTTYAPMFERINQDRGDDVVEFAEADMRQLPFDDASMDGVCCISVLEHTDAYPQIVREFARVLKPGGIFVLTFDLSRDGKFTLHPDEAHRLLDAVFDQFEPESDAEELKAELSHVRDDAVLSTDYVQRTSPELLPWTTPVRAYKALRDLFDGKGWTGGFRSRTVFALSARKRGIETPTGD